MKLLIFIPDGVGIKNYLYSNFFEQLLLDKEVQLDILTSLPTSEIEELVGNNNGRYSIHEFSSYKEGLEKLLREAIRFARLSFFAEKLSNPTILSYNSKPKTIKGKLLQSMAKLVGGLYKFGGYNYILSLEKRYQSLLSKKDFGQKETLVRQIAPDVILSTHQRPTDNIALYEIARRLSIKRTSVIYSWDNVSKAALYTPSDKYFLWSTHMKNQMEFFYPEIPSEKLIVTGTPQFSFYHDPNYQWSREAFCKRFNIPADRQIVLFSGSDLVTSPYDSELLQDMIDAINKMPSTKKPVLIFRRSPADFSGRYDKVLKANPDVISIDPLWINRGTTWRTAIPTREDIRNLVGLIQHVSLIINVGSTMALDGATLDKPCMYIAYTPDSDPTFNYGKKIHTEDHFRVMKELGAVAYVNEKTALFTIMSGILEDPTSYCQGRKAYLAAITDNILSDAGSNIIKELKQLVAAKANKSLSATAV